MKIIKIVLHIKIQCITKLKIILFGKEIILLYIKWNYFNFHKRKHFIIYKIIKWLLFDFYYIFVYIYFSTFMEIN